MGQLTPSDASLRRVGLAWYAEEIPAHCSTRQWIDKDKGTFRLDVLDRDCVLAITGKEAGETFTEEDRLKIRAYLAKTGNKLTDANWLRWALEQTGVIGKPISTLQNASRIYDIGTAQENVQDVLHDTADSIGGASKFLSKLFDPANLLAIVLLVIGGGLVMFGAVRLLT